MRRFIENLIVFLFLSIIGGFTGGATVAAIQEPPQEKIDFNNLQ